MYDIGIVSALIVVTVVTITVMKRKKMIKKKGNFPYYTGLVALAYVLLVHVWDFFLGEQIFQVAKTIAIQTVIVKAGAITAGIMVRSSRLRAGQPFSGPELAQIWVGLSWRASPRTIRVNCRCTSSPCDSAHRSASRLSQGTSRYARRPAHCRTAQSPSRRPTAGFAAAAGPICTAREPSRNRRYPTMM